MFRDPLDFLVRRPWRDATLPADATGIPTMLSKDERRLLYGLARDYARDDAAIVDAGCFLGGSAAALLAGVRDRPDAWTGPPVVSYANRASSSPPWSLTRRASRRAGRSELPLQPAGRRD